MSDNKQISGDAAIVYCLVCKVYEVMNGETLYESWANTGEVIRKHRESLLDHVADTTDYRDAKILEDKGLSLGTLQRESSR